MPIIAKIIHSQKLMRKGTRNRNTTWDGLMGIHSYSRFIIVNEPLFISHKTALSGCVIQEHISDMISLNTLQ